MSTIDMSKETTARSAMKLALEALEYIEHNYMSLPAPAEKAITALREALASEAIEQPAQQQEIVRVPVTDNTYNYAKSLAEAIFKQHFASDEHYASGRIVWGVNDTVIGILTQIDNMVADMVRRPAQQEPVGYFGVNDYGLWEENEHGQPFYTSPPAQRTWVGLTDEEIFLVLGKLQAIYNRPPTEDSRIVFAQAIEAKLKAKNFA